MLELLKVLAPLLIELVLSVLHGSKEKKEEKRRLREEILETVRGGDAAALNQLVNRLRTQRKSGRTSPDK